MSTGRRPLWRIRARLHSDERGFTMVEVLVAILIFGLMISGIATMQGSTMNLIRNNRHRSVAANLAADEMDTVRSTPFTSLPLGRIETARTVDGVPYTVARESEWVASNASAGACDAPASADPVYLRVSIFVTWPLMTGVEPVTANTLITPPVGTYDATAGHLAVSVVDADGLPAEGIQVSITGPEAATQATNSDGCVFFAYLAGGSYSATASRAGYVSDQGVATPSQAVTVVTGAIASLLFQYDSASTLNLVMSGKDAGSPAPNGVPIMLANTHILPDGMKLYTGSGSPRVIPNLFPYADGYEAWAGSCSDADPVFHVGGERSATIAVFPGSTANAVVLMPEVRLTVTDSNGVPLSGRTVEANHSADTGCPSGEAYTVGQTNALGEMLFAIPYGTWQLEVNNVVAGTVTLAPTDPPGPTPVTVVQ